MQISVDHPTIGSGPKANFYYVSVNNHVFWFSYKTCVAFEEPDLHGCRRVVRENDWGPTTGKHLNEIDPDKSLRIPGDEFEDQLAKLQVKFS